MENIYHSILDNITEIILIHQEIKQALSISLSSKYVSNHIYYISAIEIKKKERFTVFDKFVNIKSLIYPQCKNPRLILQLSNLSKLKDLNIRYWWDNAFEYIDIKKWIRLTSFHLQSKIEHSRETKEEDIRKFTFLMEKDDLSRLSLVYSHHEKITTLLNCPKLTYLHLDTPYAMSLQPFYIQYDEMKFSLQHLILRGIDFDLNLSFDNLTYLKINTLRRSNLCFTHLQNLLSLSVFNSGDTIIGNLSRLTCLDLSYCENDLRVYNLINLKIVKLERCNIRDDDKLKLFECKNITYLNINNVVFSENVNERLKQLNQEQILIDGIDGFMTEKLQQFRCMTHLILINNKYMTHFCELKYLQKLTLGCEENWEYCRKISILENVMVDRMKNEIARSKYENYLIRSK